MVIAIDLVTVDMPSYAKFVDTVDLPVVTCSYCCT